MKLSLDLQIASQATDIPEAKAIALWIETVLDHLDIGPKEMTVRVVDEVESQGLNADYRGKEQPTNVLSFAFELPEFFEQQSLETDSEIPLLLGDLVVCAPVVKHESEQQNKTLFDHWAHMIVHGTLHLLGYDHIVDSEAEHMEKIEICILQKLAIDDPYQDHQ
jgi:probable rRNA maturation factor